MTAIAGAALILAALYDMFHTMFHATGAGAISDLVQSAVWRAFRGIGDSVPAVLDWAGPAAVATTILYWLASIVFGFALLYWPQLPHQFVFAAGLNPIEFTSFIDAINLSIGSLITLSGDVMARPQWLKLLMGLEAVIGFALLTASVSWLLSIYPVLETRRSLAHHATLLHNAEHETGVSISSLPPGEASQLLQTLSAALATVRNELSQFPVTYYFRESDQVSALPGILPFLARVADEALRSAAPEMRVAGAVLGGAVKNYIDLVGEMALGHGGPEEQLLREYADDHLREKAA
jgi:hypothetical protein